MSSADRLARLSENFRKHAEARVLAAGPVWGELWNDLEQELLERLLQCGPEDDLKRFRCQVAIQVARDIKRMVEVKGVTPADLEKEMAFLDGTKLRPVA